MTSVVRFGRKPGVANLSRPTRALMRALLDHHSVKDTHALLSLTVSGTPVTYRQVRAGRHSMLRTRRAVEKDEANKSSPAKMVPLPPAPRPARVPLSSEEQMARVAAGARLVERPVLRRADVAYTLGGVASGLL